MSLVLYFATTSFDSRKGKNPYVPKIPKQMVFYTGIFAMQISIGIMPFLVLTKMWTLGGIITTLNIFIYYWLGCAFLIGRAVEKGQTQERITALKISAILALLIIGFALATQLVLPDGIDDIRQMKAAIATFIGAVIIGLGVVFAVPRSRKEIHQTNPRFKKGIRIATIVALLFILFGYYNWYKAAANCECDGCHAPCACRYPECTNLTDR